MLLLLGVPERAAMYVMGWSHGLMAKRYQHVTARQSIGWRNKALSRGVCILLGLAALVSGLLAPHQPGAMLGGLAVVWAARPAHISDHLPS